MPRKWRRRPAAPMRKTRLKKNDTVLVLAGSSKGLRGRVLQVDRKRGRVLVEGANIVHKHVRPESPEAGQGRHRRKGIDAGPLEREAGGRVMAALRLKDKYAADVVPALRGEFGYRSSMAVPRIMAVKLNMGIGKKVLDRSAPAGRRGGPKGQAKKASGRRGSVNQRIVENAVEELAAIAGQKPVVSRAKRPIAGFNLRAGMPVACTVTLRGRRMWEFVDRLIAIALPRVRDFQGVSPKLDGRGNYTLGIQEHTIFPEIDYTKVDVIKGMNVTFITTARTDREGYELLRLLGMPFRTAA